MAGLFVKKGDTVQVIAGKDKGVKGKVIVADPDSDRVLVEGANRIKKHTKVTQSARGAQQGGIVTQEAPVHVSNVQVVCPAAASPPASATAAASPTPTARPTACASASAATETSDDRPRPSPTGRCRASRRATARRSSRR